jgi:hypothetical protein
VKFKGLQEKAKQKIEQIAAERGLTRAELSDRLVPDLDLDEDGSKLLDFGTRQFRVGFDEHLAPYVTDAEGNRQKDLPKPGKSDDAEKAKEAADWWKACKKDAKTLASQQIFRLEQAMCERRTWDVPTFRLFLLDHPLVFHLVRRLVWATYVDGKIRDVFRVAEDRSLAGADDETYALKEDATVGIAHLLDLGEARAKTWGARLGEYEIVQPFAQLSRDVYAVEASEKKAAVLKRVEGTTVPIGKVLGLESRGWRRGMPQDAGWIWDMVKPLPGEIEAELRLDGGILAGNMSESPEEQKLGTVTLRKVGTYDDTGKVALGDLADVVFSELVRDLELLRA